MLLEKKGKTTLNYVEVLPSSSNPTSSSKSDPVVPLKVITRAQTQAQKLQKGNDTERSNKTRGSWKACRERRAASKRKREQVKAAEKEISELNEPQENTENQNEEANIEPKQRIEQPSGSILEEKHFKPLDALLKAYEERLKPLETLEERWRKYPDPAVEARQLEIYQRLMEVAQALKNKSRDPLALAKSHQGRKT